MFPHLIAETKTKKIFMGEHEQTRHLIKQLGTLKKDTCELALKLSENYLRFEEKLMFPYLENTLHSNKLATIGKALSKIEITAQKITHKF